MSPQRYPINSQPFEDIRKRGLTYVDKTDLVYQTAKHMNKKELEDENLPITKVALNFDSETRNISEWIVEEDVGQQLSCEVVV